MSALGQPLTQIGTTLGVGQCFVTDIDLPKLSHKYETEPAFREALRLAEVAGSNMLEKTGGRRMPSALRVVLQTNSRSSRLHAQEQEAMRYISAKENRSVELARFL